MLVTAYLNLAQMACDLFAIPEMSSECERSFSKEVPWAMMLLKLERC